MKISYKKLWIMLAEQEMTKQEFREKLQIASGTMTKLNKGQVTFITCTTGCIIYEKNTRK